MSSTFLRLCYYNFLSNFFLSLPNFDLRSWTITKQYSSPFLFLSTSSEFWLPLRSIFALLFESFHDICRAIFGILNSQFVTNHSQFFHFQYLIFFYRVRFLHLSHLVLSSVPYWVLAFLHIFLLYTFLCLDLFVDHFGAASASQPLDGIYK